MQAFDPSGGLPPRGPVAVQPPPRYAPEGEPPPYTPKEEILPAWVAHFHAQYGLARLPSASWLSRKTHIRRTTVRYLAEKLGLEIAKREPAAQKSVNGWMSRIWGACYRSQTRRSDVA